MPTNLSRLLLIAGALDELLHEVIFVGGSVAEFYADDSAATNIRQTMDVDCVIRLKSYNGLTQLEKRLRKLGFKNDTDEDAPICRWVYAGEKVDVMPDDKSILGFSNKWYGTAFDHREKIVLPDGREIWILPTLYYIATKIEALRGRGDDDWRLSHDFEDIVYVLNNSGKISKLWEECSDSILREYLAEWANELLARPNMREEIECQLDGDEIERTPILIEKIKLLSKG